LLRLKICAKKVYLWQFQPVTARDTVQALDQLAWMNTWLGRYPIAHKYAYEAQKLVRVSGDLLAEARAVYTQAVC
jgi:hypothetical protein